MSTTHKIEELITSSFGQELVTRFKNNNLKGTWLEQAGFTIDTPVSVTVEDGQLSIVRERCR